MPNDDMEAILSLMQEVPYIHQQLERKEEQGQQGQHEQHRQQGEQRQLLEGQLPEGQNSQGQLPEGQNAQRQLLEGQNAQRQLLEGQNSQGMITPGQMTGDSITQDPTPDGLLKLVAVKAPRSEENKSIPVRGRPAVPGVPARPASVQQTAPTDGETAQICQTLLAQVTEISDKVRRIEERERGDKSLAQLLSDFIQQSDGGKSVVSKALLARLARFK